MITQSTLTSTQTPSFRTKSVSSGEWIQTKRMIGSSRSWRSWRAQSATRSSLAKDFAVIQPPPKNNLPPRSVMTSADNRAGDIAPRLSTQKPASSSREPRAQRLGREASSVELHLSFRKAFKLRQFQVTVQVPRARQTVWLSESESGSPPLVTVTDSADSNQQPEDDRCGDTARTGSRVPSLTRSLNRR